VNIIKSKMNSAETQTDLQPQTPDSRMDIDRASVESQVRISAVKEVLAELSAEHHDVAGVTLYGSTARGEAGQASDIDGYMYVDVGVSSAINPETDLMHETNEFSSEVFFEPEVGDGMSAAVHMALAEKLGDDFVTDKHDDDPFKDFKIVPISEELILQSISEIKEVVQATAARRKYSDRNDGLGVFDDYSDDPYEPPAIPEGPDTLGRQFEGLFHPDVSGSLAPYRQVLLRGLSEIGDGGQIVWENVKRFVETFEGRGEIPEFPDTLELACEVYGVN
jgi:predicted nucleotidyltransferase